MAVFFLAGRIPLRWRRPAEAEHVVQVVGDLADDGAAFQAFDKVVVDRGGATSRRFWPASSRPARELPVHREAGARKLVVLDVVCWDSCRMMTRSPGGGC
jgi:hypothetical protein